MTASSRRPSAARWLILAPALLVTLLPTYWMLSSALKSDAELGRLNPTIVPQQVTLHQFGVALADRTLLAATVNSGVVAVLTALLVLILGSMAAYAVTQWKFRGVRGVLAVTLYTQLLPQTATLVPIYLLWNVLGLTGRLPGIVGAYSWLFLPVAVWMLVGFFRSIPIELTEAALIDGARRLRILWSVVLPVARPGLAAVAAYTIIVCWGEFLFALVVLDADSATVTLELANLIGEHDPNIGPLMAAATIATAAPLIIFFLLQRQFTSGLTGGAIKS
jgi:ABC-type glycerol-3-phosphate transport system permease component